MKFLIENQDRKIWNITLGLKNNNSAKWQIDFFNLASGRFEEWQLE